MNPEDIQKALEAISKGGINVKGDLVLEKHVEHEVANVEPGGIGIQINSGKATETVQDNGEDEMNLEEQVSEVVQEEQEGLNFDSPRISLQQMLKNPWFADMRSDERYDETWTDAFVEALMGSEFGEGIAREWNNGGKLDRCTQIKGYVLGLLKDAGVLKGSYDAIAEKVNLIDKPRTFSRYMSDGKKQPYALWVKEYVGKS